MQWESNTTGCKASKSLQRAFLKRSLPPRSLPPKSLPSKNLLQGSLPLNSLQSNLSSSKQSSSKEPPSKSFKWLSVSPQSPFKAPTVNANRHHEPLLGHVQCAPAGSKTGTRFQSPKRILGHAKCTSTADLLRLGLEGPQLRLPEKHFGVLRAKVAQQFYFCAFITLIQLRNMDIATKFSSVHCQ